MLRLLKIFTLALLITTNSLAHTGEYIIPEPSKDDLVGESRFRAFFFHVYDAKLFADNKNFSFNKPFILSLDYNLRIKGEDLAKTSDKEIRRIGFEDETRLAGWFNQMNDIFPDVKKGDNITGVYRPNAETIFLHNGNVAGVVKDKEFGKWFFGIWLNENTREPKLREKLLGLS